MSLTKIEELIKELINKVNTLATKEDFEAIAAKIIEEVSNTINKETTQVITRQENNNSSERSKFQKYSFPNFNVGNPSLGSSKSPNALKWPFGTVPND